MIPAGATFRDIILDKPEHCVNRSDKSGKQAAKVN